MRKIKNLKELKRLIKSLQRIEGAITKKAVEIYQRKC